MAFESGKRTTVAKPISPADTTIYLASVPTVTSGRLYLKNDAQEERISFSGVSWNTVTGCNRNLSKVNDPVTSGTWLTRVAWTVVKLVLMHDQIVDKAWANTRVGNQTITGDLDVSGYLEADRIKAIKWSYATTYASTAARDSALGGNGVCLYPYTWIQANGVFYNYNTATAQREAVTTGTATWWATTSAIWSVELSTQTETEDQTTTGGAWPLVPTNATINPNNITSATPATGDKISFADISNSNKLRSTTIQTLVDTARPLATNAEASTGTGTTQSVTPAQLKKYFWPEPSAGTTYTASSATGTLWSTSWTTYLQARIWTIARTGTYTVEFSVSSGAWVTWYGRIYKNGVAFWTERTVVWTTTAFTQNLAFTEWDTISLWYKSGGWGGASVLDFYIKYDLTNQNAFTLA